MCCEAPRGYLIGLVALAGALVLAMALGIGSAPAQAPAAPQATAVPIPGFWDPKRRPELPDLSRITLIRFLTEVDYPPFNYAAPDGSHAGFNVDLARMICEELRVTCTIQMRRFDTLLVSLAENRGDAVMASIAVTPQTRARADFSDPYYRTPARFVARRRCGDRRRAPGTARRQEGRGRRRHRARGLFEGLVHGSRIALLCDAGGRAQRLAGGRGRPLVRRRHFARVLAQRQRTRPAAACFAAGRSPRADISARASGSRCGAATTRCGWRSTGRCSGLWERGKFSDLWLRYFPISPY